MTPARRRRPGGAKVAQLARTVLCVAASAALVAPIAAGVEPDTPGLRLVDESVADDSGDATPSGAPGGESGGPDDPETDLGDEPEPETSDDETDKDDSSEDDSSIPLAAQAGMSLGAIGLAALALVPGRRPPARIRRR